MDPFKYVDVNEIKVDGKLELALGFKPKWAAIVMLIAGTATAVGGILLQCNIWLIALGVFFIVMSFFGNIIVKDYRTVDFYDKGVVIYKYNDPEHAFYKSYDEIVEWTTKRTEQGADAVWFKFNDDTQIYKDTFQCRDAFSYMIKRFPTIESNQIRMKKVRSQQMSIPEAVEYWRGKLLKKVSKKDKGAE